MTATEYGNYSPVQKIYLSPSNFTATRQELLGSLRNGALLMNYFGHQVPNAFSGEGLLRAT